MCRRKRTLYVRHYLGHHGRLSLPDLEGFSVWYGRMGSFEKEDFLCGAGQMGDAWHLVNLGASPSLPAPRAQHGSSRERWDCPGGYRSSAWLPEPAAPSCSRSRGLHTPEYRCPQERGLSWLRPQALAVPAWGTTVISSLFFCLHFQY